MRILFLTHYFPPEMGALAARAYELSKIWAARGHHVTVITGVPNYPTGVLHKGYENRLFQRGHVDGIEVIRVCVFLTANRGVLRRTLNYLSFAVTSFLAAMRFPRSRHDVVLASSPQFFNAIGGYLVSRAKRLPFVLEIRDLWPQAIVAVGALRDSWVIRLLERTELFLCRKARHVVVVAQGIADSLVERGVPSSKVSLVPNGVDLKMFRPAGKSNQIRMEYGLSDCFVVSYIGTHGMPQGLHHVLSAAERLRDENIRFLFIGEGTEKGKLVRLKQDRRLDHVLFIDQQPRERIPRFIAASDACLVSLLGDAKLGYALPSKLCELMACARPVILSAAGASRAFVERARCGVVVEPEQPDALAEAILKLRDDPALSEQLGRHGREFVVAHMDRARFAVQYEAVLERAAGKTTAGRT